MEENECGCVGKQVKLQGSRANLCMISTSKKTSSRFFNLGETGADEPDVTLTTEPVVPLNRILGLATAADDPS